MGSDVSAGPIDPCAVKAQDANNRVDLRGRVGCGLLRLHGRMVQSLCAIGIEPDHHHRLGRRGHDYGSDQHQRGLHVQKRTLFNDPRKTKGQALSENAKGGPRTKHLVGDRVDCWSGFLCKPHRAGMHHRPTGDLHQNPRGPSDPRIPKMGSSCSLQRRVRGSPAHHRPPLHCHYGGEKASRKAR